MDRINQFRQAILAVMDEYASERANSRSFQGFRFEQVVDEKNNRYQLVLIGWKGDERIYHLIFHIDIVGEKIWVQEDQTQGNVATMLVAKGISKKDVVLAYLPDYHRQHTEYAVS